MPKKSSKKYKTVTAYANIGSHNGIFEFYIGPVADKYPHLMHVYSKKLLPSYRKVKITYEKL